MHVGRVVTVGAHGAVDAAGEAGAAARHHDDNNHNYGDAGNDDQSDNPGGERAGNVAHALHPGGASLGDAITRGTLVRGPSCGGKTNKQASKQK